RRRAGRRGDRRARLRARAVAGRARGRRAAVPDRRRRGAYRSVAGQKGDPADARADRRDREGGRAMGLDTGTNGAPALTLAEGAPVALRRQIEATRAELGDTVAALAVRADVKAQARSRLELVRRQVQQSPLPYAIAGAVLAGVVLLRIVKR